MCLTIGGTFDSATCNCDLTNYEGESTTEPPEDNSTDEEETNIDPFNLVGLVTPAMADIIMGSVSGGMFVL